MNSFNDYIKKYGNFSYILNVFINEELSETEKNTIILTIYNMLNDKDINKNLSGTPISIKWRVSNEKDLLHYYTDGIGGILSDNAINEHTKKVMNDICKIVDKNKFSYILTKPLTKKICIM